MSFVAPLAAALPGLTTALTIGGTALSVIGTVQGMQAQAAASDYNAALAQRDAVVAGQNRQLTLQQSRIDAEDKRREGRRVLASMRATYGTSGVSMAGSPLDVLEDTAVEQELDARRVEYEGKIRAREGALQMLGLSESANLSRMEARSTRRAIMPTAIGQGMSGAGTALSRMN